MISELASSPLSFLFSAIAIVVAITIHEFAHAYTADRLGDPTPRLAGRLTLNPLSHLDPLGTLALFLFRFGWGKPVPFDPFNLRNPHRDSAIISLAGPASNIVTATICAIIIRLPLLPLLGLFGILLSTLLEAIIILNVILAVFNLLPIHPLDGFKVVGGILSEKKAREWYELSQYGIFFLLMLILPLPGGSILGNILWPPIRILLSIFLP